MTIVFTISRFELVMSVIFNPAVRKTRKNVIHTFYCESLSITSNNPATIHVDGENAGERPVTVKLRKSRVALITKYHF
ncbi:hypothetical protein WQ54_13480 [Bacillus sp. SA1-12]|nr:hypothetical protein WQ54_13480 [Bacillus sp. SA1-12]